jgi:hypothetical protein
MPGADNITQPANHERTMAFDFLVIPILHPDDRAFPDATLFD